MNSKRPTLTWLTIAIIITLLSGILSLPVASAGPPAQDPRPTVGPPPGGNGGPGPVGGQPGVPGGDGAGTENCATVSGQVLNWGFGGEGGVALALSNGSWQLATVSATDGNYGFGGLGVGAAKLHTTLAPELVEALQPHIQDAGIYLNCDYATIANLAVSGAAVEPPATIQVSAGRTTLGPGDGTEIILTIENGLPTDITNVVVTVVIPNGLIALDVSAVVANDARLVSASDGQLAAVYIDRLAPGDETNIRVLVMGAGNLPAITPVTTTATLFYRESVADQAVLDFTIGRGSELVVEPTAALEATLEATAPAATATPEPEPTLAPTTETAPEPTVESESGEEFVPPGGLPSTGDDFVPPGFLPTTGEIILPTTGAGFLWPLGVFGLVALAIGGHYLLSWLRLRHKK